ncbi:toxin-antitoxin system YwqK family antitoxin [Neisseria animaloris]|uniref:toxin-antitoxin system YwqK family antitoxin n=1 Tax=Neisseria animaloris TaxID=326522 RepID=UPI0039DF67F7
MNRLLQAGFTAAVLVGVALPAAAETMEVYFNQQGQVTASMSAVSYVRKYEVKDGTAQVQDFYYPSLKKYSDPYQITANQIKEFVPALVNGTITLWHFNGQKKMTGQYKNGKPDGEWINWYPNGKKSAVMPYAEGKSEGTGARFYRNGNKESEIQFKNNQANGYWKQWYQSGEPKTEMVMVNDKPVSIISWNEDGLLLSEITMTDGKRNGIVLDWHDNGAKKSEAVYQDGELIKKTVWDEEGYLLEE